MNFTTLCSLTVFLQSKNTFSFDSKKESHNKKPRNWLRQKQQDSNPKAFDKGNGVVVREQSSPSLLASPMHGKALRFAHQTKYVVATEQIKWIPFNNNKRIEKPFFRKETRYAIRLRESRKLCWFYKLSLKALKKVIKKSSNKSPTQRNQSIFALLESRLDVILYRSQFFESIKRAKKWILKNGVYVNKKKVISPATIIIPGDIISISKIYDYLSTIAGVTTYNQKQDDTALAFKLLGKLPENKDKVADWFYSYSYNPNCCNKISSQRWRFKASAFRLALLKSAGQSLKTGNLALSQSFVFRDFYGFWQIKETASSTVDELRSNYFRLNHNGFLSNVYRNKNINTDTNRKFVFYSIFQNTAFVESYNAKSEQETRLSRWLLSSYKLFLKKQWILNNIKKRFINKTKKIHQPVKSSFDESNYNIFSIVENLAQTKVRKRHTNRRLARHVFNQKKINCYTKQKSKDFFKDQRGFTFKKAKPLHLEISYKSLTIIALWTPQHVYYPFSIKVSPLYAAG